MPVTPRRLRAFVHRTKLRTRVLVGVLMVTLIALAGSGYAAASALHGYLLAQTDSNLQAVLNEYKTLIVQSGGLPLGAKPKTLPVQGPPGKSSSSEALQVPAILDTYYVGVTGSHRPTTELAGGNNDLVPSLRGVVAQGAYTMTSANGQIQLRVLAEPVGHVGMLIVTTSLTSLDSTASRLQLIVIISSLAGAVVAVTGVGFVVRRGLRPVEMMAAAADKITAGDLTSRVRPDDPATELGRLGAALNGMLTRIEGAVREREASEEATRRFFADASHELRTPLASLRANAELYRQGALPRRSQVDEAMRRIIVDARRMGGLVDDMLRLARLDQHPRLDRKPVDLSSLAAECAERARIANPGHTRDNLIAAGLVTMGDEELLRRAIDNMLTNVAAHTPVGTTAVLTAATGHGTITIEVSDNGPGIPSSELAHIFDRFYRARVQMPRPGSGLGLAIVAATAAAHGGTAQAALNVPNGLRVTIAVPGGAASAPGGERLELVAVLNGRGPLTVRPRRWANWTQGGSDPVLWIARLHGDRPPRARRQEPAPPRGGHQTAGRTHWDARRLDGARQAETRYQRGPSVPVREKADGAHRPSWWHGRRPPYVRGPRNATVHSATR